MNPWQALLGPVPLPPAATIPDEKDRNMAKRRELRAAAGGRVHLVGDEPYRPEAPWVVARPAHVPAPAPRPPEPAPVLAKASIPGPTVIIPGPVEIGYESQGVCTVHLPAGSMMAEVFFPKIGHGARAKTDEKIAQPCAVSPTAPATAEAPVPRKAAPPVAPSPAAYRVKAPPPKPLSYADAIQIRARARMRQPVPAYLVDEANALVEATRKREGYK